MRWLLVPLAAVLTGCLAPYVPPSHEEDGWCTYTTPMGAVVEYKCTSGGGGGGGFGAR